MKDRRYYLIVRVSKKRYELIQSVANKKHVSISVLVRRIINDNPETKLKRTMTNKQRLAWNKYYREYFRKRKLKK